MDSQNHDEVFGGQPNVFSTRRTNSLPLMRYSTFRHFFHLYSLTLVFCGTSVSAIPDQYAVWRITPDQLSNAVLPTDEGPNIPQNQDHHPGALMADPREPPQGGPGWRRPNHQFSMNITSQFPTTTTAKPLTLAEIPTVGPDAELSFHANETLLHVRTASWLIAHGTCLEVRYRLEGKRTRYIY